MLKTSSLKPISIQSPTHLPNVNQTEAIAKQYNNVADLAMNAIASAKNKQGQAPSSPRANYTPGRRLASSESKHTSGSYHR